MTFEEYVQSWEDMTTQIAVLKKQLKPLTDKEMEMRRAIAESLKSALGDKLKEGVNNWTLPDGRTLKFEYKVKRDIAVAEIGNAREAYMTVNDRPVEFDDLLRIKYELEKKAWNKLDGEAVKAVSRMVTAKEEAPALSLE